jgi:7,8-dihydropterin-6-yl-methyl-4-(beta-D-ribofuranosyl)aminobenzene 5'-phosphate synthase
MGFGCLIEVGGIRILFDTGGEMAILAHNLEALGIDVDTIDFIVLSHEHWDHVGGLNTILDNNRDVKVYLPGVFPYHIKSNIRIKDVEIIETSNATVVCDCVSTTSVLEGNPREQGLILKTDKGLIVLTGCSHPGVDEIVENAKKLTGEDIYLVMGGYHLGSASSTRINSIIERLIEMDVEKVAPSHCTGDDARDLFKDKFGENCISVGVGFSMDF